ncbi:MAG: UDP-N-acetylglucosamine--N-acetylmuramyl-(pentapeptide) pyrophosphoryl-undecaprenol N-acetylglucosamine transferase [Alphaproteobacteria bacterium]|nr:MAG: UDP-N-acetylglucosamine--N-acetylmuramyl-(pentapeptide) pyrophosphoryl-undecaprenol N-acetylglucosamine transferase [Alphaproteobacteria bacterium]
MSASPHIVLVGGGTGGHVMSAVSVGEELIQRNIPFSVITDIRGSSYWPDEWKKTITSATHIRTRNPLGILRRLCVLGKSFYESLMYLRRIRPTIVLGFGAYPTVMPLLAARILRIPLAIFELDTCVGAANKILMTFTRLRMSAYPLEDLGFKHMGIPVRQHIEEIGNTPYRLPATNEAFVITVLGGSQGASLFSQVIPKAFGDIKPEIRDHIILIHQAPASDVLHLQKVYRGLGLQATVEPFVHDMATAYMRTHIMISRAGAATIGEVIATTRPTIFVPYARAAKNHQLKNAQLLEHKNAAIVIPEMLFIPENLTDYLNKLFYSKEILLQYSKELRKIRHPGAASRIVTFLCKHQRG